MLIIFETTNSSFQASDKGRDYPNLEGARKAAVEAAAQIAVEELRQGRPASAVEVILKDLNGVQMARLAISLSVADLMLVADSSRVRAA